MKFPKWIEFTKKIGILEQQIIKTKEQFKNNHPLMEKAIKESFNLLPPPINMIASNIYQNFEGSEENKLESVIGYLEYLKIQGEEHYNNTILKLEDVLIEVTDIQEIMAQESTLIQIQEMLISSGKTLDGKITILNNKLDFTVDGISTIITKITAMEKRHAVDQYSFNSENEIRTISFKDLLKQADHYFRTHAYAQAFTIYEIILSKDNNNLHALANEGLILDNLGRTDEAIEVYDKAIEIDKNNPQILNNRGTILDNLNRLQESIECYDKAIEISPKYSQPYINKAIVLDKLKKFDDAIVCYEKALEIDPTEDLALYGMGTVLSHLGKKEEAIVCYDKAIEINDKNVNAFNNKGKCLDDLGKYEKSILCYDKVLELEKNHPNAAYNKANALKDLGRIEEALYYYDKAIEINSKDTDAINNKGQILENSELFDDAIVCYDQALAIDPKYWNSIYNKANVLLKLKKYENALEYYDECSKIAISADMLNMKGIALKNLQRFDDAIVCYDQALAIDPNHKKVHDNKRNAITLKKNLET